MGKRWLFFAVGTAGKARHPKKNRHKKPALVRRNTRSWSYRVFFIGFPVLVQKTLTILRTISEKISKKKFWVNFWAVVSYIGTRRWQKKTALLPERRTCALIEMSDVDFLALKGAVCMCGKILYNDYAIQRMRASRFQEPSSRNQW